MELTQKDYDERKARQQDGTASDDDNRLIKLYEREGFEWRGNSTEPSDDSTPNSESSSEQPSPSTAPTTGRRSSQDAAGNSGARSTAGRGRTNASSTATE